MSEKTTGFESAFEELPGATVIDQFSDARDFMLKSAVNFEVRLGRLFLSDSNGEPSAWVDETEEGYQLLYVALTRPTKTLVIAHSGALPKRLLNGKMKKKVDSNELADIRKGSTDLQRATPF